MRVFRGRGTTIEADRDASRGLLSVAAGGESAVRVWIPHRQVAFGRRDRRLKGYDRARSAAGERGFPPVERDVGGRAVAYDGETTVAFARAEPVADFRRGTGERYERLTGDVAGALRTLGVDPERGEPGSSFCPGAHSLSATHAGSGDRRKLAGIAQRVRQDAAVVAGILLVDAREEVAGALEAVYGALEVPLDPTTVGTVADAGGEPDPRTVRRTLERALVDGEPTVEPVSALSAGDG